MKITRLFLISILLLPVSITHAIGNSAENTAEVDEYNEPIEKVA